MSPITLRTASATEEAMILLQRTLGNRAVARILRSAHPSQTIQRTLIVDGQQITHYAALPKEQETTLLQECGKKIPMDPAAMIEAIIEEIIASPIAIDDSLQTVIGLIDAVAEHYFSFGDPETLRSKGIPGSIAATMLENDNRLGMIGPQMGAPSLSSVGRGNALATATFMEAHPEFMTYLKQQKIKTIFNANKAKGMGGMYGDGTISIEEKVGKESKDVFLRTLIHEMGHATFQQLLLKDHLSDDVSKGEQGNLADTLNTTNIQVNLLMQQNVGLPGQRTNVRNIQPVQQQSTQLGQRVDQKLHLEEELAKFSDDGLQFYNAWLVLRQDDGRYLLGMDLGSVMSSEGRKPYQAERFEEFCAESFMHIAKEEGALSQHIKSLQENDEAPGEVKHAWDQVWVILQHYKSIIVEGG
jgi:hypothetical protein